MLENIISFSKDTQLAQKVHILDEQFLTKFKIFIDNYLDKINMLKEILEKLVLLHQNNKMDGFYSQLLSIKATLLKDNLTILNLDQSNIDYINSQLKEYDFDYTFLTYFPQEFWQNVMPDFPSEFILFMKNSLYNYIIIESFKINWIYENKRKSLQSLVLKEYMK